MKDFLGVFRVFESCGVPYSHGLRVFALLTFIGAPCQMGGISGGSGNRRVFSGCGMWGKQGRTFCESSGRRGRRRRPGVRGIVDLASQEARRIWRETPMSG